MAAWEIHAIHFASDPGRRTHQNFLVAPPDLDPTGPMPMDFYCWLLRSGDDLILVDTGFTEALARRHSKEYLRDPLAALELGGVDLADIPDVVVTHLHYDHAGNLPRLPEARVHVQSAELVYASGPHQRHHLIARPFDDDITREAARRLASGSLLAHDGDYSLRAGVEVLKAPGHTPGSQVVAVETDEGVIVLASDTVHLGENLRRMVPFPILDSVGDLLDSMRRCLEVAGSVDRVLPGHDPAVCLTYPEVEPGLGWYHVTARKPVTAAGASTSGGRDG